MQRKKLKFYLYKLENTGDGIFSELLGKKKNPTNTMVLIQRQVFISQSCKTNLVFVFQGIKWQLAAAVNLLIRLFTEVSRVHQLC